MFEFCLNNIKGIIFHKIEKERMIEVRIKLKARFQLSKTIPGTRSFHQFNPESIDTVSFKRTSEDLNVSGSFSFTSHGTDINDINIDTLKVSDFILCTYDSFQWIGMIGEINNTEKDVMVKFMHPHGPFNQLFWPSRADECWVPINNILCSIEAPVTTTGRMYSLTVNTSKQILKLT